MGGASLVFFGLKNMTYAISSLSRTSIPEPRNVQIFDRAASGAFALSRFSRQSVFSEG